LFEERRSAAARFGGNGWREKRMDALPRGTVGESCSAELLFLFSLGRPMYPEDGLDMAPGLAQVFAGAGAVLGANGLWPMISLERKSRGSFGAAWHCCECGEELIFEDWVVNLGSGINSLAVALCVVLVVFLVPS
jgi:hypothetical protein